MTIHPEFQVNTYTNSSQSSPVIATLADGKFVIAWHSQNQDNNTPGVYGQMYNSDGSVFGSEFLINSHSPSTQGGPAIEALNGGGFVVSWNSYLQDGSLTGIYSQQYLANGTAIGSETPVNVITLYDQFGPEITGLSNGNYVISWTSYGHDGMGYGAYGRIFSSDGSPISGDFLLNTNVLNNQQDVELTSLANGNFVAVWTSYHQGRYEPNIFAQVFSENGTALGAEIPVNTFTSGYQLSPVVAALENGNFVVSWHSHGQTGDSGVYAQIFTASGTKLGVEFQVETDTLWSQRYVDVTGLNDGRFVITWQSSGGGDDIDVKGQIFLADGSRDGGEFSVNSYDLGNQHLASVDAFGASGFVVTWQSNGQDGSSEGVYARIFEDGQAPTLADLTITEATLSETSVSQGHTFSVDFTVDNSGESTAAASTVGLAIWDVGAGDYVREANGDLMLFGSNPIAALTGGAQDTNETNTIDLPTSLMPGQYRLVLLADYLEDQIEGNEENNNFSLDFEVTTRIGSNALTFTGGSVSSLIENSTILSAFAYQYGTDEDDNPNFELWDGLNLTFDFHPGEANPDGEDIGAWSAELTTAFQMAFADIAAISGLTFTEVDDGSADIDLWSYNDFYDGYSGYSWGVGGSGVYIDEDSIYNMADDGANGLAYGGSNYRTVIHEIFHNLGLSHPHDRYAGLPGVTSASGDTGDFALNQNVYTVMSYNRVKEVDDEGRETTGWPFTPSTVDQSFGVLGAFDIAYTQALYGANMSTATGNDVYNIFAADGDGVYFKAIWDAGGNDEFAYTGTGDVIIDLRAATLDMADGMMAGGMISWADGVHGGFTIANGTVIERATGDQGDDLLIGNAVKNRLMGRDGDDVLIGLGGGDSLKGGKGKDLLNGGKQDDVLIGGNGRDKLLGGDQKDILIGGNGRDYLAGGKGRDTLTGGNGVDTFVFNRNSSEDTITDWQDGIDRIRIKSGAANFAELVVAQNGDDVEISFGSVIITLENTVTAIFDAGDFVF